MSAARIRCRFCPRFERLLVGSPCHIDAVWSELRDHVADEHGEEFGDIDDRLEEHERGRLGDHGGWQ